VFANGVISTFKSEALEEETIGYVQTTVAIKINASGTDDLNVSLMDKLLKTREVGNPIPLKVNRKDSR
jgi:hypothetical protein